MDVYCGDSEAFRDGAGVLSASPSENIQDVILWIKSTPLSQGADRTTHGLIGHFDEAKGNLVHSQLITALLIYHISKLLKLLSRQVFVKGLVLRRSENLWEVLREESAENQVGISHSKCPALLSIADWAGISASRLRTNFIQALYEGQLGATTCSDRINV